MITQQDSRRTKPRTRPLVLIADHDGDTRDLYGLALAYFGFQTIVDDGAQVVARASETAPDVIVTDICLPSHDGWSVIGQLKRDSRTRDIPIVLLTGYAAPSVRERASREGCAALLMKPYLPDELARALRELLGCAV
jgi:two-component system phosphate regulon response regulator PhoB